MLTVANGESLVVSGHPAERGTFDLFLAAMGRPDLVDDPRFVDVADRLANFDALADIIRAVRRRRRRRRHVRGDLLAPPAGGRSGASARRADDTEWATERGAVVEIDDRGGGTIRVPNVPWRFSGAPDVAVSGVPKYRGEDNRAVLAELLGYDDDRLDDLEADGVLSSRVPTH